ncbi:hypothetical protein Acr_03g0009270 [Actinidia rufa]|uniref:Uncharacterized protein n=1 Tax=Actinidia rufa TaxID=165716 RepID=A0A7J0ECF4_9ERIC|nr:hypothetical protein Acr_03g0009270 [Actinidia rufa]
MNIDPLGTNFEGIRVAKFSEIIELDNTKRNKSSLDDDWEEIVSMLHKEQELRLSAIAGHEQMSDSTVQICLPDEVSLITADNLPIPLKPPNLQQEKRAEFEYSLPDEETLNAFDDMIIPQHILCASLGNSIKDGLPPSNVPIDILEKLQAQNFMHCNARSTLPGYCNALTLGNSYHNQQFELSYTERQVGIGSWVGEALRGSDWLFLRGGGWAEVAAEAGREGTMVKWTSMGVGLEVAEDFCSGGLWLKVVAG